MSKNIVEKVLQAHLREGEYVPGKGIGIRIDQTLVQDATGTMAFLQFEALGLSEVKTDLSVTYIDHNTQQIGFENSDDHLYLQGASARFGAVYSRAGNGICHQVHLERFGKPGTTLLGADSHTTTGGGIGQIAIGAGGLDVAVAMGGGAFPLTCPKVYLVKLTGRLQDWVTAKDVVLKMLSVLSTKGNVGVMLEYGGEGVKTLSVPQRATITNMGAEMGVTTSVFPSDEVTRRFLKAQNREKDWTELSADADAKYDRVIEIDLSTIEPLVATPHSPGNVKKLSELEGMKVDQVCIGSCTNSSYKDMMTTAAILKGRTVHPDVSLGIAPGSRQILLMLAKSGALADLLGAGGRIMESACTFCIGNEFSPKSAGISIRTSNRNFEGRSGTKDAQVYLSSPEVAAVAALAGKLTDPRKFGIAYPKFEEPEQYVIDDGMFLIPKPEMRNTPILRGPNIGEPPRSEKMPQSLKGEAAIKVGDKITTDHITPAGSRLKYRSNVPKYSEFVFENVDATFFKRAMENKKKGIHNIIVAGESYGQGSSREHAAMCPMYLGVKAVVAKSFERIHTANLINFGILPLVFKNPADYDKIEKGDKLSSDNWRDAVIGGKPVVLSNERTGEKIECAYSLSETQREMILAGGLLNKITAK
ncbi:MAG: Homoaconitase large subunit [Syntrophaceae bacterium PtaU1.Bin231]|nr:MAG: Homoaconitase large subunit [Syntrophaceae bacterium PtaU1.Bin231]